MQLSQSVKLKQKQSLVMTPQLQQAIKLLQLSNLELSQHLQEQVDENPFLELGETEDSGQPIADSSADNAASADAPDLSDLKESARWPKTRPNIVILKTGLISQLSIRRVIAQPMRRLRVTMMRSAMCHQKKAFILACFASLIWQWMTQSNVDCRTFCQCARAKRLDWYAGSKMLPMLAVAALMKPKMYWLFYRLLSQPACLRVILKIVCVCN
jgi:predicted nuclease of predicted toxin-antitoxin system